ncbi:hypothetical protein PENTCL1PPCAC_3842 [Pristionchus entomophagus]|uniref:CWH43-like N-terminal domain-containing protein n=1 Tax=Pristionchus entomophagus TaxID=358040 RepID=A0AAV5SG66_9BILA|nr:hypothetical protein PENTCL1PPCAC_3842 [Pristionchus entomophagus]
MESIGVWTLPLVTSLLGFASIFVPYFVAVHNGHVPAVLPFISDSGCFPPEKCIFSLLFNLTAFFLAISIYLRHRQILEFYGSQLRRRWKRASFNLMLIGVLGAFTISAVASFSATENMLFHLISAVAIFQLINIYIWGQVFLSFKLVPSISAPVHNWTRFTLALLSTLSFFLLEIAFYTKLFLPKGYEIPPIPSPYAPEFYERDSPYWLRHTVLAASEWSMVIFYFLFILSMSVDLRDTYVRAPRVYFKNTAFEPDVVEDSEGVQRLVDGVEGNAATAALPD